MSHEVGKWQVKSDKKVSYELDDKHILYIEKTDKGLSIKVYERGNKEVILYSRFIANGQLGYIIL